MHLTASGFQVNWIITFNTSMSNSLKTFRNLFQLCLLRSPLWKQILNNRLISKIQMK